MTLLQAAIGKVSHLSDKLLPAELGRRLRTRARQSTMLKLENFMELRDFIAENEDRIIDKGWMEFYSEAGNWMDYSAETVRKYLSTIRSFPDESLKHWIKSGLSFDHIETANWLQNDQACHFDADSILDAAVSLGNGKGERMTVDEMIAFALGEKVQVDSDRRAKNTLLDKLSQLPHVLKWGAEKVAEYKIWLNDGRRFFA